MRMERGSQLLRSFLGRHADGAGDDQGSAKGVQPRCRTWGA